MIACPSETVQGMNGERETTINAAGRDEKGRPLDYRSLNVEIRKAMEQGSRRIIINGVMGQRYIASAASSKDTYIGIHGTPGNNLGAFLDGPTVEVFGNAQDMTGNTMSSGRIIVHGNAWDVTGLAARGGRILVQGSSGYRVGIHMKAFGSQRPSIIIGGAAADYLGEYMAGGIIAVLGHNVPAGRSPVGSSIGAGIHGGVIYVHGKVEEKQLGTGAVIKTLDDEDRIVLEELMVDHERSFHVALGREWHEFKKIVPLSSRPFRGRFDPTPI